MGKLRRARESALWVFDWYLRLDWVGKTIAGIGAVAGMISSASSFFAAVEQGITPLIGLFLALLALVLVGVLTLIIMEITGKRNPQRTVTKTSPAASLGMVVQKASERVPVVDALLYAVNRVWPGPEDKLKDGQDNPAIKALFRLREAAGEGQITVWGQLSPQHLTVAIPPVFWVTNQFDIMSVVFQDADESKTEPATFPISSEVYQNLKVDKVQVEELWPRA